jgi:nucleotide-binding universal stress UspA family protein
MEPAPTPRHVIVAYDFSPEAEHALTLALDTAHRDERIVLHLVAAIPPDYGLPIAPLAKVDYEYADQIHQRVVERVWAACTDRGVAREVHFFVHARIGAAGHEILSVAEEVGAELILVGSHGRTGVDRMVLGSVSERVVREARCPVMVCRPAEYRPTDLLTVVPVAGPHHRYVRPHRYAYVETRVQKRPDDWPLS